MIQVYSFLKETKTAVFDDRILIFQPCQCAHLSLHALGFSALLCFLCSVLIRFLILQSFMQDWLLQCTHIARLTDCMCPDVADLQEDTWKKLIFGTVNQFITLRTLWLLLPEQITTIKTLYVTLKGIVYLPGGRMHSLEVMLGMGRFLGHLCFYFDIFLKRCVKLFIAHFKVTFESNMWNMEVILYLNLNLADLIQVDFIIIRQLSHNGQKRQGLCG